MNLGTATVIRGDARSLPLPDDSVDLIVTSPPYFALRSYQDNGEHYPGQIGSEVTPAAFLDALWACTREWMRVLKSSGSLWVNLGDSYYSGKGAPGRTTVDAKSEARTVRRAGGNPLDGPSFGIRQKSLCGLPWRYAIGCIDQLGLILRAEVIWSKPNGLPESVTDRVRRSHEQWFHLVMQPRYFSAVDEIREAHAPTIWSNATRGAINHPQLGERDRRSDGISRGQTWAPPARDYNPLGKLPGSVWTVPTEPLTVPDHLGVDHFAAFPTEWPRRIIAGWSPAGICVGCGEGRRPVSLSTITADRGGRQFNPASGNIGVLGKEREYRITGYACACPTPDAPTRPAVILDPFGGTGTTALVAKALGRHGISVDLSHDYSRLARWRTSDPAQLAKVLGVDKPPQQTVDQLDLFGGVA